MWWRLATFGAQLADADNPMQVWHSLAEAHSPRAVTTLGFFDGLHVGHQHLLQQVRHHAAEHGAPAVAVTLWPHPRIVLGHAPHQLELINDLESKLALLAEVGLDGVVVLDFTLEMAAKSAGEFLSMICQSPLAPSAIFMGYDHRFGHGGQGDFAQLEAFAQVHRFEAYQSAPVMMDGLAVSSTLIRESIRQGQLERAMRYMDRPFAFWGTVGHGFQLGQELGFPTANIAPRGEWQLLPGHGVYEGVCQIPNHERYQAVVNVGTRPTVNSSHAVSIEAHLLGYSGDLYGANVEITFLRKLRDELKFSTLAALKAQIAHDVASVMQGGRASDGESPIQS